MSFVGTREQTCGCLQCHGLDLCAQVCEVIKGVKGEWWLGLRAKQKGVSMRTQLAKVVNREGQENDLVHEYVLQICFGGYSVACFVDACQLSLGAVGVSLCKCFWC